MRQIAKLALVLIAFTAAAQQPRPVRLSWQEFAKDPKRVQSFRNAVAKMRSRDTADPKSAEFRKSWVYWASIHGFFGPDSPRGTVAQWRKANGLDGPEYDAAFKGVVDTTPPDVIAKAVWGTCQHTVTGNIAEYFFPWHRLYLYYFERVLQEAANDPTLRLPYWDYTSPSQLRMPAEFTTPTYTNMAGRTVPNPLYEERRDKGWNDPSTKQLSSIDTNIDQKLDAPNLLGDSGYQAQIEAKPHGYAHCAVKGCRATVMGAVPYSANDPIFYIHHANIDRLWDCWTSISGHNNPTGAWRDKQFSFVNELGQLVTKPVRDLFNGSLIQYVYQQPSKCARTGQRLVLAATMSAAARQANTMLAKPMVIGEQTDDMNVDAQVSKKRVTLPATASLAHPRQFALRAQSELPVVTELVLRGIHFTMHPRTEFLVYLERADDPARRAPLGTLSFFSDEPVGSEHAAHASSGQQIFDATDALRSLGLEGTGALEVNVVIEADPDDEEHDFDPKLSGLVIDAIELRVRRDV